MQSCVSEFALSQLQHRLCTCFIHACLSGSLLLPFQVRLLTVMSFSLSVCLPACLSLLPVVSFPSYRIVLNCGSVFTHSVYLFVFLCSFAICMRVYLDISVSTTTFVDNLSSTHQRRDAQAHAHAHTHTHSLFSSNCLLLTGPMQALFALMGPMYEFSTWPFYSPFL